MVQSAFLYVPSPQLRVRACMPLRGFSYRADRLVAWWLSSGSDRNQKREKEQEKEERTVNEGREAVRDEGTVREVVTDGAKQELCGMKCSALFTSLYSSAALLIIILVIPPPNSIGGGRGTVGSSAPATAPKASFLESACIFFLSVACSSR